VSEPVADSPAPTAEPVEEPQAEPVEHDAGEDEHPAVTTKQVPLAALKDERKKRQQLERELAEMRGKVEGLTARNQDQTPKASEPEPQQSEEEFFKSPVQFTQQVVQRALSQQRLELSEAMAREKYEDYDDAVQAFVEAAKTNPALIAGMRSATLPAEYAYRSGKTYQEVSKYGGDIATMREQMRKELRAELEAEAKTKTAESVTKQPTSLAQARGVSGQYASSDDDSLKSLLTRRRK
jgi:ribosome modulation factor